MIQFEDINYSMFWHPNTPSPDYGHQKLLFEIIAKELTIVALHPGANRTD
jgi:hypothetical protein